MKKPYHEVAGVAIIHGDCFEELPKLERSSVHTIIADHPWGIDYKSRRHDFEKIEGDDSRDPFNATEALRLGLRALVPARMVFCFCAYEKWPDMASLPVSKPLPCTWCKGTPGYGQDDIGLSTELFLRVKKHTLDKNTASRPMQRLRRASEFHYPRVPASKMIHPNEKPIGLYQEIIEIATKPGETVLDYCAGSGAAGEAAIYRGRRAILIEKSEEYCEKIAKRITTAAGRLEPSELRNMKKLSIVKREVIASEEPRPMYETPKTKTVRELMVERGVWHDDESCRCDGCVNANRMRKLLAR